MDQIHRRGNSKIRRKLIWGGALCLLGLFILLTPGVRAGFSRVVYMVAPSVWEWGDGVGRSMSLFSVLIQEKEVLVFENKELKDDLARMETLVLDRNLLEERLVILEETLGRKGNDNRILARVLLTQGRSPYDTFVVDVGSAQDVARGDLVVYAGAGVVGEILEAYEKSSKVKLHSFPGETHPVLVGEKEIPGTAIGRGMGNFEVKIPRDSFVISGDMVFSPTRKTGQEKLILGIVGFVEKNNEESFERILFRTPFNTTEMRSVEILRSKGSSVNNLHVFIPYLRTSHLKNSSTYLDMPQYFSNTLRTNLSEKRASYLRTSPKSRDTT